MAEQIQDIQGKITYADGEEVSFRLYSEGNMRWGNTDEVLARAVDVLEQLQADVVGDGGWVDHYAPDGATATWEFSALDRNGGIANTIEVKTVYAAANPDMGLDEQWHRLEISDVSDVLDAWRNGDPHRRSWRWPDTENADDPAVVAFVGDDGNLHMAEWPAFDDNEFNLNEILEGTLLPLHHYRIERKR